MKSLALAASRPVRPHGAPRWLPGLLALLACVLWLLAGPALATAASSADRLASPAVVPAQDLPVSEADALAEAVALAEAMQLALVPADPFELDTPATVGQQPTKACCITGDADQDSPDRDWALTASATGIAAEPVQVATIPFQPWPLRATPPPQRPPRARA